MRIKYKTSLLLLKFKRYGGDGIFTKIITESNKSQYQDLLQHLSEDEVPLIVCKFSESDWTLLTDRRLLTMNKDGINEVLNENLKEADMAFRDEYANGVMDKLDFTKIRLTDVHNAKLTINIEKGLPYVSLLQVLHFIATR